MPYMLMKTYEGIESRGKNYREKGKQDPGYGTRNQTPQ